jgi:predicted nucleotidyltransferase
MKFEACYRTCGRRRRLFRGVPICFFTTRGVAFSVAESEIELLAAKSGMKLPSVLAARAIAEEKRAELRCLIDNAGGEIRGDMNMVVFGSLARGEWTSQSDLDWSLLIDGQADPADVHIGRRIERLLTENNWTPPGRMGVFGTLAFSHSLVHDIGGIHDSHANTTRRICSCLNLAPFVTRTFGRESFDVC